MKQRQNFKTPAWTAVWASFTCGFFAHLFGLVTILHNCDDIAQQPRGYGTGITSGRWLLSLLGDLADGLGGNYNLPLVNGVLFLALVACAAGLMVQIFEIRSRGMAALMGMLAAVFPSVFSTLAFRYTVIYYGISIVMAVLAALVLERYRLGWLYSAVLTACSMGIYQAYVPITISIFVLRLLQLTLSGQTDVRALIVRGLRCCGALLLGLAFYFMLLKASLILFDAQLSSYKGVDQMGKLTLSVLLKQVKLAYYMFLKTPFKDFWGFANTLPLKGMYFLLECVSAGMLLWILCKRVKSWQLALAACLLCLVFPAAVGFVIIMCPESDIYTLMMYAYVLVPCVPCVLLTCLPEEGAGVCGTVLRRGIAAVLALMIFSYGYQTNVNYTALYYSNRQIENYMNALVTQVRMTDGFTAQKKWAFLGVIEDPLLHCYWQYEMDYGGEEFTGEMLKRYSWDSWMWSYCGYMPPLASEEEISELFETEEVSGMPCWPDAGSIRVIGDTVVVKFSQTNVKPH